MLGIFFFIFCTIELFYIKKKKKKVDISNLANEDFAFQNMHIQLSRELTWLGCFYYLYAGYTYTIQSIQYSIRCIQGS